MLTYGTLLASGEASTELWKTYNIAPGHFNNGLVKHLPQMLVDEPWEVQEWILPPQPREGNH